MASEPSFRKIFGLILILLISGILVSLIFFRKGETNQNAESPDLIDHPGAFYTITKKYNNSNVDGYNLYVPNSCTPQSEAFPLIVFLQGGMGIGGKVSDIFKWELPKELKETKDLDSQINQLKLNTFVYIMPHISYAEYYHGEAAIQQILDEVIAKYNIDENRIYLTGLSRGGFGTWGLASKIPDRFAAIAPIAGGSQGISDYEALAELPIWVAHNLEDERVEHYRSQKTVQKIEQLSGEKFHQTKAIAEADYLNHDRIFTTGENKAFNHDAWTEVYNEMNFYKWLLRFRRE